MGAGIGVFPEARTVGDSIIKCVKATFIAAIRVSGRWLCPVGLSLRS